MAALNPKDMPSSGSSSIHANILRLSTEDVYKKYEIVQILGEGSMGAVSKVKIRPEAVGGSAIQAKHKKKGLFGLGIFHQKRKTSSKELTHSQDHLYALKSIQLDRVSPMFLEELENEIEILRSLDHPNIVKAHEVFKYKKMIFLVLELCDGGDLYTRSPYSERDAAKITTKLLKAIRYMHDHGIVHRDLKYENVCFESRSPDAEIKVIDFGLSKKFAEKPGIMTDRVGTIYTMAPQVLQGVYSSKADLWSVGVLSYMLISTTKPFYSRRRRKMVDQIMRGAAPYDSPTWGLVSAEAKDFCQKLIVVNPKNRMDGKAALDHPWIVNQMSLPDNLPPEEVLNAIDDSLINYKHTSHLKKLALNVIAHRSTQKEILELRKAFESFDTTKDGVISFAEFREALKEANYSEETLTEIFSSVDVNKNGRIMYTEFLAATIEAHGHIEEDRLAEAFDRLDSDDTGFISPANLRGVLGEDAPKSEVDAIIKSADTNGDGQISFEEFLFAFRKETTNVAHNMAHLDTQESMGLESSELMGLDAKIPGGKYDSARSDMSTG